MFLFVSPSALISQLFFLFSFFARSISLQLVHSHSVDASSILRSLKIRTESGNLFFFSLIFTFSYYYFYAVFVSVSLTYFGQSCRSVCIRSFSLCSVSLVFLCRHRSRNRCRACKDKPKELKIKMRVFVSGKQENNKMRKREFKSINKHMNLSWNKTAERVNDWTSKKTNACNNEMRLKCIIL